MDNFNFKIIILDECAFDMRWPIANEVRSAMLRTIEQNVEERITQLQSADSPVLSLDDSSVQLREGFSN